MATIHDVAREAGVSPTTVSRYLNNRIELPGATSGRIDAAIQKLDYRPNLLAKRLSMGKSEAIGLVTPEIGNPFFAELAAAVEDEAERHGYAVFMTSTRGDRAREISALQRLEDRHVDGLIMLTNHPDEGGALAALIGRHSNVVLLDEDIPGVDVPRIFVENEKGAYLATRHLISRGHTRIGLIEGPRALLRVEERRTGFFRAMAEAGLDVNPDHVLSGTYTREFGQEAVKTLLGRPDLPTALLACSDYLAVGVMQALKAAGLKLPQDMSLVGFDDMPFAELVEPALTTVRQPIEVMGRLGFQVLHALLTKQDITPTTRLPVTLIERASEAPPRTRTLDI